MTDIFEEHKEMQNATNLSFEIRKICNNALRDNRAGTRRTTSDGRPTFNPDPDGDRRRCQLALKWPGDELVQQIIKDTVLLMKQYDIQPKQVK